MLLTRTAVRAHDPSALTSAVYLAASPPAGNDAARVGSRVLDVATYAALADAEEDRLVWVFTLLVVAVSAGYGAIAVANTLLMAAARCGRELRLLRTVGATTGQVRLIVAYESALIVTIGALLGAGVALIALVGGVAALTERAGTTVHLVLSWPAIGGVIGLCLGLALVASLAPTLRTGR